MPEARRRLGLMGRSNGARAIEKLEEAGLLKGETDCLDIAVACVCAIHAREITNVPLSFDDFCEFVSYMWMSDPIDRDLYDVANYAREFVLEKGKIPKAKPFHDEDGSVGEFREFVKRLEDSWGRYH